MNNLGFIMDNLYEELFKKEIDQEPILEVKEPDYIIDEETEISRNENRSTSCQSEKVKEIVKETKSLNNKSNTKKEKTQTSLNFEVNEKKVAPLSSKDTKRSNKTTAKCNENKPCEQLFKELEVSSYNKKSKEELDETKYEDITPIKSEEIHKTITEEKTDVINVIPESVQEQSLEDISQQNFIYDAKPVIETKIEKKEYVATTENNASKKNSNVLKQFLAYVATLIFIIGIPLIFSSENKDNENNLRKKDYNISMNSEYMNITTEDINNTNKSTRFNTLDDLTLYISSNQGVILSNQKQAVTQFENGIISETEYEEIININLAAADELNHLLTVNKSTYIEGGMIDTYNTLSDNMDNIFIYSLSY